MVDTLAERYAQERLSRRIKVESSDGTAVELSPGGQNTLIAAVLEGFCGQFVPGGKLVYVGDASKKWAHFDSPYLARLGVEVDEHGKMPDVVVHHVENDWLILVEAVTSHGPVDPKRRHELEELFGSSSAGLVYVTAFLTRRDMTRYLGSISWETEVWVAESPTHLIHFDGERFLGPYG